MRAKPQLLPAWQTLSKLASERFTKPYQAINLEAASGALSINFTKQHITEDVFANLISLAEQSGVAASREAMFAGEIINASENRAALHTALRAPLTRRPDLVAEVIESSLNNLRSYATEIRSSERRGYTGKSFRSVVHIGIGGSHLGPELISCALEALPKAVDLYYVANIDGHAIDQVLKQVDPETTLFIIVSKTFSTLETRANANAARSWFLERSCDTNAIGKHFCAVSANIEATHKFGIDVSQTFPIWDWVGGRYSLWSAVGLPILITYGAEVFEQLLAGAHALDRHFVETPLADNLPVLMALIGVWNINFLGINNLGILPYDQRLRLLPDFLQQLEMESNGKSVHADNTPVEINTMSILWGGVETNGQHAFHQLLHQGTTDFTADLLVAINPSHSYQAQHDWLLASCFGQSEAFLIGKDDEPHKKVVGQHPTTTLLIDQLNPFTLGFLLALYEQKVFVQGVIWQINSFDQWGVELGKNLALKIHKELHATNSVNQDPGTKQLINTITARRTNNE